MTPLMLYQNYHLVHHLHPSIPFYRYIQAWRNNENIYLSRAVPIATAWGRELTTSEYRAWRQLVSSYQRDTLEPDHGDYHRLRVSEVRRLARDAVSITFDVPDHLERTFRFTPGQHLALRTTVDGAEVRRTYSICTAAGSGLLRIAVKRIQAACSPATPTSG